MGSPQGPGPGTPGPSLFDVNPKLELGPGKTNIY